MQKLQFLFFKPKDEENLFERKANELEDKLISKYYSYFLFRKNYKTNL